VHFSRNPRSGHFICEAEIEGRRQFREFFQFFRKHVPGCENARLYSMGAEIGVRETRRIMGRDYVGEQVFLGRQKFPDGIARIRYCIDVHSGETGDTYIRHLEPGEYYEIPYGCLVAKDRDNLLMAGRCISTDRILNGSLRVMPPCCSLGVAAGMAAVRGKLQHLKQNNLIA
jgi:FAD dependent oxidoreductase